MKVYIIIENYIDNPVKFVTTNKIFADALFKILDDSNNSACYSIVESEVIE